jgi:putative ABC transport system permease protein
MLTLARRNLLKEKTRLAISVGGVAFAVVLIVLLRGLYLAYETKVAAYYESMNVDAWVLQRGSADLAFSYSRLPLSMAGRLERIYGVEDVIPYSSRQIGFKLHGKDVAMKIAAFNPRRRGSGPGPLAMRSGTRTIDDGQIIIDDVFARRHGVGLGDSLDINGQVLEVAGISKGGDLVVFQYGFVTRRCARELLESKDMVTAFLLVYEKDAPVGFVRDQVTAMSDGAVMVKSLPEMVTANRRVINEGFLPVLGVLLTIGFCVGVAVIGLTIYSAVLEHRREYGILKAVGARSGQMLLVVAVQAMASAVAGYAVGVGVSLLAARGAELWVPQFITSIQPRDLALVGVAALLMGLIAAFIPLGKIAQVDPAVVFRA